MFSKFIARVFKTNWKTSLCGLIVLFALVGRYTGKLDKEDMQYLVGVAVTGGLFLAKDGVREDTKVAPEDVPS